MVLTCEIFVKHKIFDSISTTLLNCKKLFVTHIDSTDNIGIGDRFVDSIRKYKTKIKHKNKLKLLNNGHYLSMKYVLTVFVRL